MGGLEVLPKRERSHFRKEDAFRGFAGCDSGNGDKCKDDEVDAIGEMHFLSVS